MNNDEPIYELSANWEWAHEAFFKQHFVGKRLSREPYAKGHHVTFTDGTAVAVTDGERNKVYHVDRDSYTGAGIIERAWIDTEDTAHTTSSAKLAPRKPEPAAASRYAHETPSTTARRSPPHGSKRPIRTRNPPITATTRKQLKPFRCTLCSRVICAPRSSPTTPHATAGKQNTRTSPSSAAT